MKKFRCKRGHALTQQNRRWAERAHALCVQYDEEYREGLVEADQPLTDILTNMLHLAASQGLDFEAIYQAARNHFNAETLGKK